VRHCPISHWHIHAWSTAVGDGAAALTCLEIRRILAAPTAHLFHEPLTLDPFRAMTAGKQQTLGLAVQRYRHFLWKSIVLA
jgi:hypothetical protein